ncbi:MBL fold metallo-hydrolase [Mesorhizobium sp. ANAO-SY3R2]|uniref:MBL fold metallo-hydrolase n=1 Tax=Mesorhizobium sp. ANAO-SY3R2 TaxID=3166644 RepID=UPI003672D480
MSVYKCEPFDRRDFLCCGGAALFSAVVTALIGSSKPASAIAISGAVPEIDRLTVSVVVDNYQFAVTPSRTVANVDIRHFGWGIADGRPPGKTLVSEFGLSMHAMSQHGDETRNVLVDFGFTPDALLNNSGLMGINSSELDALVLSHGHYDHFGGLAGFLEQNKGRLKDGLPIYIGGEEAFCSREWTAPPVHGDFGALDRSALEEAALTVRFAKEPSLVADHAFTTGQIGQMSFEKLLSPTSMRIGVERGMGCYAEKLAEDERTKSVIPDQFRHEIATVFNLKGRGLIILTSCSHRGVINTIKQAQLASGISKVHAVIGGFHLAPYKEEYVRETIATLKDIDVDYIIPLHCSGEPFFEIAKGEIPNKLLRSYTGTRFAFG